MALYRRSYGGIAANPVPVEPTVPAPELNIPACGIVCLGSLTDPRYTDFAPFGE